MSEPDEIIHQSLRLKIMAALYAEPQAAPIEFTRLKGVVQATDGNLGAHLATLERAGYVAQDKDFDGKRPRTRLSITPLGRKAFRAHVDYLRNVLEAVED